MRVSLPSVLSLLFAASLFAAEPTVTDLTPTGGPTGGGTEVTITGTGFTSCPQGCRVFFGNTAAELRSVSSTTIVAVAPAHLPGAVPVAVGSGSAGYGFAPTAFTFSGDVPRAFARLLLPVFVPPIRGAHGSEFRTGLTLGAYGSDVLVYGIRPTCQVLCGWNYIRDAIELRNGDAIPPQLDPDGTPGRFIYVRGVDSLVANLRAFDVSRSTMNFGTELPIIKEEDFRTRTITLLGVPLDPLFRNTLRIYSAAPAASVRVTFESISGQSDRVVATQIVHLRPSRDIFEPAYAELPVNAPGLSEVQVRIEPLSPLPNQSIGGGEPPIWAFVSVTNNETQMITTITPQP